MLLFFPAVYRLWKMESRSIVIKQLLPWENGYIEAFNGKMKDELLAGEIFHLLKDAQVFIEIWRQHDNTVRPHSSLDYTPPPLPAVLPLVLGICRLHYLKLWYKFLGRVNNEPIY